MYRRRATTGFPLKTTKKPSGTTKEALASDLAMFAEWNRLAAMGIDPRNNQDYLGHKATFIQVAEEWLEAQKTRLNNGGLSDPKTYKNYVSRLKNHAYPALGHRQISDITPLEVSDCLRACWHSVTGEKVRWLCEQVCLRAIGEGLRETNFAQKEVIISLLSQNSPITNHRRFINVEDVPDVYRKLLNHQNTSALMLRLMMLSCIRVENIVEMQWSWINFDFAEINIPAADTKTKKKKFRQPMTAGVMRILREQLELTRGEKFVFASQRSLTGHVSNNSPSQWIRNDFNPKHGYNFQPSGLRGTFRRWADSQTDKFSEAVIEETYMHVVRGIKSFYTDRELFEQKKPLLEAWNEFCLGE